MVVFTAAKVAHFFGCRCFLTQKLPFYMLITVGAPIYLFDILLFNKNIILAKISPIQPDTPSKKIFFQHNEIKHR